MTNDVALVYVNRSKKVPKQQLKTFAQKKVIWPEQVMNIFL